MRIKKKQLTYIAVAILLALGVAFYGVDTQQLRGYTSINSNSSQESYEELKKSYNKLVKEYRSLGDDDSKKAQMLRKAIKKKVQIIKKKLEKLAAQKAPTPPTFKAKKQKAPTLPTLKAKKQKAPTLPPELVQQQSPQTPTSGNVPHEGRNTGSANSISLRLTPDMVTVDNTTEDSEQQVVFFSDTEAIGYLGFAYYTDRDSFIVHMYDAGLSRRASGTPVNGRTLPIHYTDGSQPYTLTFDQTYLNNDTPENSSIYVTINSEDGPIKLRSTKGYRDAERQYQYNIIDSTGVNNSANIKSRVSDLYNFPFSTRLDIREECVDGDIVQLEVSDWFHIDSVESGQLDTEENFYINIVSNNANSVDLDVYNTTDTKACE